jgi:hypothetical protein
MAARRWLVIIVAVFGLVINLLVPTRHRRWSR